MPSDDARSRPLPESLLDIGHRIVTHFEQHGEPPYLVYQYHPKEEYAVRRDVHDLELWLGARGIRSHWVSLAAVMWRALEETGWVESLLEQEREAAGDPVALDQVYRGVGEVLRTPPALPDRVVLELEGCGDRTAAFLCRAGALYPAYRTSALLEDLQSRVRLPVTLLYPGIRVGAYGLQFMNRCEPAYAYRAHIVSREDAA